MSNWKIGIFYVLVAMAAGGFTSSHLTLPPLPKAVVVAAVAGVVMDVMVFALQARAAK